MLIPYYHDCEKNYDFYDEYHNGLTHQYDEANCFDGFIDRSRIEKVKIVKINGIEQDGIVKKGDGKLFFVCAYCSSGQYRISPIVSSCEIARLLLQSIIRNIFLDNQAIDHTAFLHSLVQKKREKLPKKKIRNRV